MRTVHTKKPNLNPEDQFRGKFTRYIYSHLFFLMFYHFYILKAL